MKKILTILIFILFSNTATAKEYLMTCGLAKYKLIYTFFSKKLHVRKDAQWLDYCDGFGKTLEIYEDGAKCTTQLEGKDAFVDGKWRIVDRIDIAVNLDFYLKTFTFNDRVASYKNTTKCF
jgi:hypothetical protein